MLSILQQLLVAGNETTTGLIGNMVGLLLADRRRWQALCEDPSLAPGIVEEALRMEAPVQGLFRSTTEEVELGGVRIPKGAQLQLLYASGNRDESEFKNPESFDARRSNASTHLSFGGGPHFCLGAALARIEGCIALQTLSERLPDLRLAAEPGMERGAHFFLRGFEHLWIEWTPRS
jgi:cytochrome P450